MGSGPGGALAGWRIAILDADNRELDKPPAKP
jgi:hypothetical protein